MRQILQRQCAALNELVQQGEAFTRPAAVDSGIEVSNSLSIAQRHIAGNESVSEQPLHAACTGKAEILREMDEVAAYRERHQPVREKTGGSTFKNPPGHSAWKLIDASGCRGLRVGGAMVSEMHCNFLINDQNASAEDIERLGETVRTRVLAHSGITLHWEIIRLGVPLPGHASGEALV